MDQDHGHHHDDKPFLIEGKLTNLHWEMGGGGTEIQNFTCLIDDQPACGQFGGAEHLPEGSHIKAVVSCQEGVVNVHAAMDETRGMIWIRNPYGIRPEIWGNVKLWLFLFLGLIIFSLMVLLLIEESDKFWDSFQYIFLCNGALMIVVFLMIFNDFYPFTGSNTEYFRLLGFEKPESVNLFFPYQYAIYKECLERGEETPKAWDGVMCEYECRDVYSVRAAIKAGKAKLRSPTHDAD